MSDYFNPFDPFHKFDPSNPLYQMNPEYDPLSLQDLCDATNLQNLDNPLSPFYIKENYNSDGGCNDNISTNQEPKKKYQKTEEEKQVEFIVGVIVYIIFIIGTIGGTIGYFK